MRVRVTGSTGLIGEALVASLEADGHHVVRFRRGAGGADARTAYWDIARGDIDADALEGVDAVVHFAAQPLSTGRLTPQVKRRILRSRIDGTRLLATTLAALERPPAVLVSASAVGVYGSRGDEVLTEESSTGGDFLADVCLAWERAATPAADAGIRVVHPRTGVVIAPEGLLIEKVEIPFRLGVGGRVGSGRQWYGWITLDDHVRALRFLIDSDLSGPVNFTGPEPITNAQLTKALGAALHRPTILPIPPLAVRAVFGGLAVILATSSQRALPTKLLDAGFTFEHTDLHAALRSALTR